MPTQLPALADPSNLAKSRGTVMREFIKQAAQEARKATEPTDRIALSELQLKLEGWLKELEEMGQAAKAA